MISIEDKTQEPTLAVPYIQDWVNPRPKRTRKRHLKKWVSEALELVELLAIFASFVSVAILIMAVA